MKQKNWIENISWYLLATKIALNPLHHAVQTKIWLNTFPHPQASLRTTLSEIYAAIRYMHIDTFQFSVNKHKHIHCTY